MTFARLGSTRRVWKTGSLRPSQKWPRRCRLRKSPQSWNWTSNSVGRGSRTPNGITAMQFTSATLKRLADARLAPAKVPRHIAVIMDGNGRWAQERGKQRIHGHLEGVK